LKDLGKTITFYSEGTASLRTLEITNDILGLLIFIQNNEFLRICFKEGIITKSSIEEKNDYL